MVVMGRKDYINKATNLLYQPAYRTINRDPNNKLKTKLITLLRKLKRETGVEDNIYSCERIHDQCTVSTKHYK